MWRVFARLVLVTFGLVAASARAATTDGALRMEVITAYNFVVDSNIESPAGKSPSAAHLGVRIFNDGTVPLTNVVVNIGDLITPATSTGTPGVFDSRTIPAEQDVGGLYSGTFALQMPGGATDAVRVIPSIAPGESVTQYFFVTYPLKDGSGNSVTGSAPVVSDDLWLNYDIWAYASDGVTTRRVDQRTKVTMRNEISAMANKIWPNGDNKVPDEYLDVIEAVLGWRPSGVDPRIPGAQVSEGIWYDLGNVGAGFDNNGDGIPDRNAWLQPVGDPAQFSPLAARMVKCYGIVIVKLNDGTEQLVPFEDQLYFENLPPNNTGAVGLVYYEFLPLDPTLPSNLTPYQEVASGYDNEKFNSDYGTVTGSIDDTPTADIEKTGPTTRQRGENADYTIVATNTGTVQFGWPDLGMPVVIEDPIPAQLQYVSGSATTASNVTNPVGGAFTVYYSTNNGTTWSTTEPVPASSVNRLRWVLDRAMQPGDTATVLFSATVPSGFIGTNFTNTAILKLGTETEVDRDDWPTLITGNNTLGDYIWKDLNRNGNQDDGLASVVGIPNIGVSLYVDSDGDGVLDPGEPLYSTTNTDSNGAYLFSNLPDGKYIAVVNSTDTDLPYGYTLKAGVSDRYAADLDSAGTNPSGFPFLTADWPFIAGLEVTKAVSPTVYNAGDLITYDIHLDNHLETLTLPSPNVQTTYSATTTMNTQAAAYALRANAAGAPNNTFTYINFQGNTDTLETVDNNPSANVAPSFANTGTITKVELIVRGYMSRQLVTANENSLNIHIRNTTGTFGNQSSPFAVIDWATLNTLVGVSQDLVIDITSFDAAWDFTKANALRARLSGKKATNGEPGDYYVDSIGFRVTTNNTPFTGSSGPNTISLWPLKDTYDPTKLQYVTASVLPDVTTPAGTLEWFNLGPVNAGARKSITVTFRALSPTDTTVPPDGRRDPMTANNYVTTQGVSSGDVPLFQSGRPAGHDDGTVDVTINPAGRIGDFVYWDVNADSTYNTGDVPLSGVIVQLYQAGVYTGRSLVTDANGYYEFTGLADGTYDVRITTSSTGDLFSLPWTTFTSYQKGVAGTNQTGYVVGDSVVLNNTDFVTTNDMNMLQDFGFDSNAASIIAGRLFRDWDGDGFQDPGDEPLVGYTVTLTGANTGSVTTDANGDYLFTNLTGVGNSTVTVTAPPANHTQTLDPDLPPGNTGGNNATTINVALGNAYLDRDFAYRQTGTLTIGDTVYYDWNGNGTQDSGEGGIANVTINLYEDSNGDGVINASDALIATTSTNGIGVYGFSGLLADDYIVQVDTADPDFPASYLQKQDYDGLPDNKAEVALTVSLVTVDFGYLPTGTGSIGNFVWLDSDNDGKSWFDLDNDNIKDPGEAFKPGIDGVTVELYHSSQTPGVSTPAATTTTSGGGFYSFTDLAPDGYYVYIPVSNFGSGQALENYPWSSTTTDTADNQQDNDDNGAQSALAGATISPLITLGIAESDQTIDFGFTGTASIGDTVFYDLNGNGNLDYSETGINGVVMELYLDANNDGIADGAFIATATTATVGGLVGFYEFTDLPPNTYIVKVRTSTLPAGVVQTADPDLDGIPVNNTDLDPNNNGDHADTSIVLFSGSNYPSADFGYQPPGSIGDYVWLDMDRDGVQDLGEPGIAGVVIRVTNGTTTYDITTDTDGYWAQTVADGNWTVSVLTPPSGMVNTYDADSGIVSPNASVAVTVSGGLVTVPAGLAQGNMGLDFGYALNGAYSLSGTVAINDDGVALPNLGKHNDIDDFIDDGTDFDVGPNDETELEGILVYLYDNTSGAFLGSTFTDAGGNYLFTNLPSDDYRVIIGTTAPPLDRAVLTTTSGNYTDGTVVTSTATSVKQVVTIAGADLYDIDFMFDPTVNYDFGDLPASYGMTGLTQDGARHIIPGGSPTLWLGTNAPDAEINGISNAQARGDDLYGTDDEDGVTPVNINSWVEGVNGGSISVAVNGSGWLVGWIDWNQDKDFLDDGEFVVSQAVTTGTTVVTFDILDNPLDPNDGITGASQSWLSRFRLMPSMPEFPVFSYVGEATNGEVEDHLFQKTVGASIGDTVWIDTDSSGTINGTETGLGGVVVELRDSGNVLITSQTTSNGSQDVDGDGVIDPVGYYRFTGLSAATYNVTIPTEPVGYDPSYDENGIGTPNTTQVVLAANEQHLTADFGYAPNVANLSGTVYFDTNADNLFGGDTPSPYVRVQLFTDPNGDGNPSDGVQVRETYTNASGYYEFLAVPTGNYVVVEVNPPGATSVLDVAVSASVPISTATDDRIPVTMVGTNITGRDFLDTQPSVYSIAGTVYDDSPANNNIIDDGVDTRVANVTVNLYIDRDGNGIYSVGDPLLATTTTNSTGDYSFSGLYPGEYVVEKINPAGGLTNDWDAQTPLNDSQIGVEIVAANIVDRDFLIDGYHGSIGDYTWYDADGDGQQDGGETGLNGVAVTLYRPGFGPDGIGGNGDDANAVATATTAGGGAYSFTGLPPGTYQVNFGDLLTHNLTTADTGNDATDSDADPLTGQTGNIVLDPGETDTSIDAGYKLDTCPDDWAEWKAQHPSEVPNGAPAANTDADSYDNLAEFAFHMPYDTGIGSIHLDHTAWIVQESTNFPGTLEGVFVRPTGAPLNVVYTLQYAAVIGNPTVWQSVPVPITVGVNATAVNNGDCTETVTILDLETLTGLTAGKGVVRIRAELDDDGGNDEVDHTTYVEPEGWTRTGLAVCGQTYNNPYARESVYTGTISAVSGQQVSFAGELLLGSGVVEAGWTYYIEVETGTNEGHRYDVASTGAGSLTLSSDADLHAATAPFNTTTTAPPQTLVGAKVSLRRHWKLAEMFPPLKYVATGSQATADQVQIFVQGAWKIYWLYDSDGAGPTPAIWVDAADGGNADQGALIIPPGQGVLFNNRGTARSQLSYGEIRVNDFIRPLPIGRSFVGGGYPLDQYAANHPDVPGTAPGRQMTKAVGFFGSRDHTTADSFFLWNADTINQGRSYSTYFLHDATLTKPATPLIRWVVLNDNVIQIRDEEVLFKSDRAVFIRTKNGLPVYTIPSPWSP